MEDSFSSLPQIKGFLASSKKELLLLSVGLVLVLFGAFFLLFQNKDEDKIEIIPSEVSNSSDSSEKEKIMADIEGAVVKPGVYELSFGSRLDELLISAGGLSNEADREWVEKTLNRAQKLTDGVKVYIPKKGERVEGAISSKSSGSSIGSEGKMVNVNTASQKELEGLWGVGPVTAEKIIQERPYQDVGELLTKKILKSNVYEKIAEQLTIY
ncbi:MAG: helix-hairpin-helix domain-containing protein [bacterium]|nr:helix-hairpin-helix domain-containing protein [bacterium]